MLYTRSQRSRHSGCTNPETSFVPLHPHHQLQIRQSSRRAVLVANSACLPLSDLMQRLSTAPLAYVRSAVTCHRTGETTT